MRFIQDHTHFSDFWPRIDHSWKFVKENKCLASRGGKRAQKTPNTTKPWGAEQKNKESPIPPAVAAPWSCGATKIESLWVNILTIAKNEKTHTAVTALLRRSRLRSRLPFLDLACSLFAFSLLRKFPTLCLDLFRQHLAEVVHNFRLSLLLLFVLN